MSRCEVGDLRGHEGSVVAVDGHGTHTDGVMTRRWSRRTAAVTLSVMTAGALLVSAPPVAAHQPVELTSAHKTPSRGPLLVDGTVSFAVYASVRKGATRGLRVGMRQGERLAIQLLIPDRAPANRLRVSQLPLVTVIDPAGRRTTMTINERTPFYEPYSGTSYLYLARLSEKARGGTYQVIVTGRSATKVPVVIGVGYREVPGDVRY